MGVGKRLHEHYHRALSLGRQIAIRALCSFLLTFLIARSYTYSEHYHLLPLRNFVTSSGLHIHHLFWGVLLLITVVFFRWARRDQTEGWDALQWRNVDAEIRAEMGR